MTITIPQRISAGPSAATDSSLTGRRLVRGVGAGVALAVLLTGLTSWVAAGWSARPVLLVAETYLGVGIGLFVGLGRTARPALAIRRPTMADIRYAFAVFGIAMIAAVAAYVALSPALGGPSATLHRVVRAGSDASRLPGASAATIALILVRVLMIAGVAEELLFRGALFTWLRGRMSMAGTIALTTTLFVLEHAYYPVLIPLVVAYGIAAAQTRARTRSSVAAMSTHIALDTGLFVAACILF